MGQPVCILLRSISQRRTDIHTNAVPFGEVAEGIGGASGDAGASDVIAVQLRIAIEEIGGRTRMPAHPLVHRRIRPSICRTVDCLNTGIGDILAEGGLGSC